MKKRIPVTKNLSQVPSPCTIKHSTAACKSLTPATPDSEAIAGHIKEFSYKPRYSKRVLSKYQNLSNNQ